MQLLKKIPFFLLLFVLFFCLHGSVENYGYLNLAEVVNVGLLCILCIILFFGLSWFISRNYTLAGLVTFFISLWYLFFGAIYDLIKATLFLHFLQSYALLLPVLLLVNIAVTWWLKHNKQLHQKLFLYLNVLFLLFCIADAFLLVNKRRNYKEAAIANPLPFDQTKVTQKPNVYFLLFDEYPGYTSLRDSFAFLNDSLYQFLNKKEFVFLPVNANYNMTFYSMSSMLNMHYIDKPYVALANTLEDDQLRIREIKNARAFQYFTGMGYSIRNYSIFDILDQPSVKGNSFVISQATLLTHKIFFNRILKDLGWHFISGKYQIPFIKRIYMKDDRNNRFIEEKISESSSKKMISPQFIYAHFNMPHPPVFCDSLGNYLPTDQIFDQKSYINKQLFLSYLKFANKKIEKVVDAICKNDSKSIVIVMSDHGYRGYKSTQLIEPHQFDNICAVRIPGKPFKTYSEKWSAVNFFRYLFNTAYNQDIPYLKDSSIFLKDKRTGR